MLGVEWLGTNGTIARWLVGSDQSGEIKLAYILLPVLSLYNNLRFTDEPVQQFADGCELY